MLFHKSIQFPLIRDTWVSRTLKGSAITSEQGLQVGAARRETAVSNYSRGFGVGGLGAGFVKSHWASLLFALGAQKSHPRREMHSGRDASVSLMAGGVAAAAGLLVVLDTAFTRVQGPHFRPAGRRIPELS